MIKHFYVIWDTKKSNVFSCGDEYGISPALLKCRKSRIREQSIQGKMTEKRRKIKSKPYTNPSGQRFLVGQYSNNC